MSQQSEEQAASLFRTASPYLRIAHVFYPEVDWELKTRIIFDHFLCFTKQGSGWIGIGKKRYRQVPGALFLIRPGVPHWQKTDRGSRFMMLNIHFDFVQRDDSTTTRFCLGSPAETLAHPSRFRPDPTLAMGFYLPERITHFVPADYERKFFEVAKWSALSGLPSQLRAKGAMLELLATLYHSQSVAGTSPAADQQVRKLDTAMKYILDHLSDPIDLRELARRSHLSRAHFSRLFRQYYAIAPMKYVARLRVEQAKHYLSQNSPIKEIADQLGYANVHHFTRQFKQVTGVPPARFRASGLS
jgi:AraC-like DNA-binding protein